MFGRSDIGCVRKNNEDRFLVDQQLGLCLLADGMGGHGHGDVAAELAVQASHHFLVASRDRFDVTWPFGYDNTRSLDENRAGQCRPTRKPARLERNQDAPGMGRHGINDYRRHGRRGPVRHWKRWRSRVYLLRDGQLLQLTVDDSWVGDLVRDGALTEQAARSHSMRTC